MPVPAAAALAPSGVADGTPSTTPPAGADGSSSSGSSSRSGGSSSRSGGSSSRGSSPSGDWGGGHIGSSERYQAALAALSAEQRTAVEAPLAPTRVVAGPGSGKTRVLTARIAHLIHAHGARPWQVVAITFTNKVCVCVCVCGWVGVGGWVGGWVGVGGVGGV